MESATIEVVHKYKGRLCVLRGRKKEFEFSCVGLSFYVFVFVFEFEFDCVCSLCWSSPKKEYGRQDGEQKTPDDEYQRGLRGH